MRILALDPGNTHTGWCVIDTTTRRPLRHAKSNNSDLLTNIRAGMFIDCETTTIEMIASYGMAVGAEVFETCVWIGRFEEAIRSTRMPPPTLTYRRHIKLHHCQSAKAKDTNIRQALVDRFAYGQPNHGKGTKNAPGWFHGFAADIWAAYALAVYTADTLPTATPTAPTGPQPQ